MTSERMSPITGACLKPCPLQPKRSEEHTSELQSQSNLVCRLLLEKKKTTQTSLSMVEILDSIGNMSVFDLAELIEAFTAQLVVTLVSSPAVAAGVAVSGSACSSGS